MMCMNRDKFQYRGLRKYIAQKRILSLKNQIRQKHALHSLKHFLKSSEVDEITKFLKPRI